MKDRLEFYKEFYFREHDKRNEINDSLSLPIGLITALIAGTFYLLTTFDYSVFSWLLIVFLAIVSIGFVFLILSIYFLIKAYSNFPVGYEYMKIPDVDLIEKYREDLKKHYAEEKKEDISEKEVEEYVLQEIIRNTGDNQRNNKEKAKFRYNCEYYLIISLIILGASLPFYGINYASKSESKEQYIFNLSCGSECKTISDSTSKFSFKINFISDSISKTKIHENNKK